MLLPVGLYRREKMIRRYRTVKAKPGELKAGYGTDEPRNRPDVVYAWGGDGAAKADAYILAAAFEENAIHGGRSLVRELESRGYDLSTIRFSIRMKESDASLPKTSAL